MTLSFDRNGVQTNTFAELFERLENGYKKIYGNDIDTDQESPDGQRIGIETALRFDIESALARLYSQIDPDLNNGDMQQVVGKLSGLYMLAASRSQWDLVVKCDRALTLPANYTISDNANQKWFIENDVNLILGTNNVTFKAVEWGDVSGIVAGSSFTQLTPELGVDSISATADAVKGRNEETEEEFRVRRKKSIENPAHGTVGAIYAKLAQLEGVSDLQVYDNGTNTPNVVTGSSLQNVSTTISPIVLPPHTLWIVVEGGDLGKIGEIVAKNRLGNTKGNIKVTYADKLTKPNGAVFFMPNENKIDRPVNKDLHVRLTAKQISTSSAVDAAAIKQKLSKTMFTIGQYVQAGELYENAYIENYNYVISDLEISLDGTHYTDERVFSGYDGRLAISDANVDVTVINV